MQALVSKTLDQASAQFAASALITTDQLLAFKSKEEQVLPSGVNGVLSGTGGSPPLTLEAHSHSKWLDGAGWGWITPGLHGHATTQEVVWRVVKENKSERNSLDRLNCVSTITVCTKEK